MDPAAQGSAAAARDQAEFGKAEFDTTPFQAACDAFHSIEAEEIEQARRAFESITAQAEARCAYRIEQWAAR